MAMYNPAHPGEILQECMGSISVAELARHIGVARVTLSRIINGKAGLSADMALRLSEAFPNQPADLWMRLQAQYDLWQASQSKKRRKKIAPIAA